MREWMIYLTREQLSINAHQPSQRIGLRACSAAFLRLVGNFVSLASVWASDPERS